MESVAKLRVSIMCVLPLLVASAASAQTQLRWKFAPGEVLNHTLSQESTVNVNVGGQPFDSTSTLTVDNVWTINKVDSQGTAEITQTTARVRMKMGSPMGSIDIDTSAEAEPTDLLAKQIAPSLKTITQAKVTFSMNPQGEVSNVQVASPDANPAVQANQFSRMLGKDGMASMVKQSLQPLPRDPLQKGASWTNKLEIEVPVLGKVATDSKLTYEGQTQVSGKALEQIKVETTTTIAPKAGVNQLAQFAIKDQSDKGTIYFDNTAGRFSHAESVQQLTIHINVAGQMVDQSVKTVRKATLSLAAK